jgi:hypothetical protein
MSGRGREKSVEGKATPPSLSSEIEGPGLPYWERTAGFRESLLQLFPRKEAKALRRVGHLLFYLVTEANMPDEDDADDSSLTRREVEAAMVDLRHVQSFLAGISRQVEDVVLERDETRLAMAAGEAAGNLAAILGALAKVLQ